MADKIRVGDIETRIVGSDGITQADVTSSNRLKVEAQLSAGGDNPIFVLQPFTPFVEINSTGVTLNTSTWNTILDITDTGGKLDFIGIAGSLSTYEIRVTVDSVVIFTISMSDLSAIGLSNATNVEMWVEVADKNFRYHPNAPVDFTSNLKIEIRATTGTPTAKYLIHYREGEY